MRGNRRADTRAERAGCPAAPLGKTPAGAGFPECDLPAAEFFILLFYTWHNGEVILENDIFDMQPYVRFSLIADVEQRSISPCSVMSQGMMNKPLKPSGPA